VIVPEQVPGVSPVGLTFTAIAVGVVAPDGVDVWSQFAGQFAIVVDDVETVTDKGWALLFSWIN